MTISDLEIGKIYEVTREFDCGYDAHEHPELESVLVAGDTRLKVGALMKYVRYDKATTSKFCYGFYFIIDGKIVKNTSTHEDLFWFSEVELS